MGTDAYGQPLHHKFALADVFYQGNGTLVGRVNQTSKNASSKTVTYFEADFLCELVIKPTKAGATIENVGLTIALGLPRNLILFYSGENRR